MSSRTKSVIRPRRLIGWLGCAIAALASVPAHAAGFAAAATPSRFELAARPGEVLSRSLQLQHVGGDAVEYVLRSADWTLDETSGLRFYDALQPGSCRPWLRLERRKMKMKARSRRSLRFEVHVPKDAKVGECRFALLIESYDQTAIPLIKDAPISLPLSGRLGVIVYVAIDGAQPRLQMIGVSHGKDAGEKIPFVKVRNAGSAHGRLEGVLQGRDAAGKTYYFPIATLPVLPGQERGLALIPAEDLRSKKRPKVVYPVTLTGRLDWDAGHFDVEATVK
ncbi:MAG: hypothetical protein H6934_08465 [Burkholderiaceae bacterium]|nr:hypothetical protein [Burkholderiaceae bacterium]